MSRRELVVGFGREGDDDLDGYAHCYGALHVLASDVENDPDAAARRSLEHLLRERADIDGALLRASQGRWRVGDWRGNERVRDLSGWKVPADVRLAAAEALGLAPDRALPAKDGASDG